MEVDLCQKKKGEAEEKERQEGEIEQLEHIPENRMMMIQYLPLQGHSVHKSTKSPLFIFGSVSPSHRNWFAPSNFEMCAKI